MGSRERAGPLLRVLGSWGLGVLRSRAEDQDHVEVCLGAGSQEAILPSAARTPWDPAPKQTSSTREENRGVGN